ncbi:hypothetical protein AC519_4435 [Pseudomonas savastanoi]|nr:hypothetical protein AC519_4435 [Pseudomonas savastanoi]
MLAKPSIKGLLNLQPTAFLGSGKSALNTELPALFLNPQLREPDVLQRTLKPASGLGQCGGALDGR